MPFTRRAFLSLGGSGRAAGSLLASLNCSRAASAPAAVEPGPEWTARIAGLEKLVRASMRARQVPGVSIALIRDARVAWTGHFGVRDRTGGVPVDDATVFSAQSMSKPVFAYRVMKLAEKGVLDLDAPLTRYTADLFVKDDPRIHAITARRVLSHTTGLPAWRRADVIQVSLDDPHFTPLYDLISHLVYVADEQDVVSVVVDGKILMRDHKILTVDIDRVKAEAESIAAKIRASVAEVGKAAP